MTSLLGSVAACLAAVLPGAASAFELTFDWGNIPLCITGTPNIVENPLFRLADVPPGARFLRFHLTDLDVPRYPHGGGTVSYSGQAQIEPGAFTYRSPCPPGETHTYRWTVEALAGPQGPVLATATAESDYP